MIPSLISAANKARISRISFSCSLSTSSSAIENIITSQNTNVITLALNRPKQLNALNLDMCIEIKNSLLNSINARESTIGAFIVKGNGGKAFCAGGDVKAIWQEITDLKVKSSNNVIGSGQLGYLHGDFFRQEYIMNYLLGVSIAPQVSLWDGIVMGGGVGLSVFGEFRVATENTLFAMPETAIGIFPDVGSSSWLPHLRPGYGNYIGMTGCRMNSADLLHTGIATHFISSEKLSELEAEIIKITPSNTIDSRKKIKTILKTFQDCSSNKPDPSTSHIASQSENIKLCFGDSKSVTDIFSSIQKLADNGNEWAVKTLLALQKVSPTSLKITFQQLARGHSLDLKSCLEMEYRIMMNCMKSSDFSEGIRALLIDKDNKPVWNPKSIEDVHDDYIESFFTPLDPAYELNIIEAIDDVLPNQI
eukprot:gene13447-18031_t